MQLNCPACGGDSTFLSNSKWSRRTNSRVKSACCSRCNHKLFLKQLIFHEQIPSQPEQEYTTLQSVYAHFPVDGHFKVAKPVQFIDSSKTIIMEYEEGEAFPAVLKQTVGQERLELASRAGMWLSRLHNCREVDPEEPHTVEAAASRFYELKDAWKEEQGHQNGIIKMALKLLSKVVPTLDEQTQKRVWIHGDFTPDNILVHGETIVGLDVAWHSRANPVMDLAPFLNHLALVAATTFGLKIDTDIAELEAAFLYGYTQDRSRQQMILLVWYRLYFLLCYRLTSLQSSIVPRYLAKIQFNNQISRLANELESILKKQ